MKKVIVTGGSGFLGSHIVPELAKRGYQVVVLDLRPPQTDVDFVQANLLESLDSLPTESLTKLANPYAIIHLSGKNIFGRFTAKHKQLIRDTRVMGTENLVRLFQDQQYQPKVFVSASAVGYYGDRPNEELNEDSTPGETFLSSVVQAWEQASEPLTKMNVRRVVIRNGHILGKGGLLGVQIPIYKKGLGGPLGDGHQYMPWIHIDDCVRLYVNAIENEQFNGTYNAVAPDIITNQKFSQTLAKALGRPHIFFVPKFALRLRFGSFADEMTVDQKITSKQKPLTDQGWFGFASLQRALENIVASN